MGRANPFANNPFGDIPRRMMGSPMIPPTPPTVQPVDVRTPEQKTMDTQQVAQGQQVLQQSDTRARDLDAINALISRVSNDPSFGTPAFATQAYMKQKAIDDVMNAAAAGGAGGSGTAAGKAATAIANLNLGFMQSNKDAMQNLINQRATLLGQYGPQRYSQPIQTTVLPGMPMIPGQASLPAQALSGFAGGLTNRLGENIASHIVDQPAQETTEDKIRKWTAAQNQLSGGMNVTSQAVP